MKIIFPVFLLSLILSCNQVQHKSDRDTSTNNETPAISASPLDQYERFVSALDTLKVESATLADKKYQQLFRDQDQKTRDSGFLIFDTFYDALDRNLNKIHERDTTNFEPLIMLNNSGKPLPIPQKLKDYEARLERNGFEVSSEEGISYIKQQRHFIAKWFYSYVSPVMKEYLQQLNKENEEGFQEDAGLTIEPRQYVDRLVWWDHFIANNQDFILIGKAKDNRKELLTYFLVGMDNSPVLSDDSTTVSDYYKTAYDYLQDKFPLSETNKLVVPYYKALLQKDHNKAVHIIADYTKRQLILDFENF